MDYGQPDGVEIDGVRIFKACTPGGGLPVVRFLHPRLTSLWQAMKQANADIYYQRTCGMLTGLVAHFCKVRQRKMIYAAASDVDFDPSLPLIKYGRDRSLYRYGIRHSHTIVAQNSSQMDACKQHFRRDAILVRSCYLTPQDAARDPHGHILWVSTLRKLKRPEIFLELARRFPNYRFRMAGGPGASTEEKNYYLSLKEKAKQLPNLEFTGFVPYAEIDPYFNQACLFINTSEFEGFPNTFLQAWARGIPTLSFLKASTGQPGHGPDWTVSNADEMAEAISNLLSDPALYKLRGESCRAYYLQNHSQESVIQQYNSVIMALTGPMAQGAAWVQQA
jgi:glycosyltransferase involved in cell wall biosynthesis